ncbi:MAG TPA: hypothetical protein VJG83_06245 [archaeon]|nr:hypothetical protein [archaeon]
MLPSTHMFLCRVSYSAQKRQVLAEFSSKKERITKRYSFFPKMYFPLRGISAQLFREVLSKHDLQRVKADIDGDVAVIFAATFSDLKVVANLLDTYFGVHVNLIEPERQFLIEKGWGYFDSFSFSSGEPELVNSCEFPDVELDFISESLKKTVQDLLVVDKNIAKEMVEKIVRSRLLKIPLVGRDAPKELGEVFAENSFFASKIPLVLEKKGKTQIPRAHRGKSEIDLSMIVCLMCSMPFNNIGFETLNCKCCAPLSISHKNVLPSSLVKVKFLCDGFYFNSLSPIWAEDFHNSKALKEKRIARRSEYSYDFYPIGPFGRNSEEFILLCDALQLAKQNSVQILSDSKPMWACLQNESALSEQVQSLKSILLLAKSGLELEQASSVASHGLFYQRQIESSPSFFYSKILNKNISQILTSLPQILTSKDCGFFQKSVAIAIQSINGGVLRDFEQVALVGANTPSSSPNFSRILVDSQSLIGVLKSFSDLYSVDRRLIGVRALRF